MAKWELIHQIVKNLGADWEVDASGPQDLGHFAGLTSGPGGMRLFFIARTEKLDPCMERSCPPLGWLRVDGRLRLSDNDLSAEISIMLRESLTAEEMANQLMVRLLPIYADFLDVIVKHSLQSHPGEACLTESPIEIPDKKLRATVTPAGKFAQSRKTLTELEAASCFVRFILEASGRAWPNTYETLSRWQAAIGRKFVVQDERMASLDFSLAAIALNLQAVRNLFPPEQAKRIEERVFVDVNDSWAVEELKQYDAAFQRGAADGLDPLGAVVGRLLHRWLGENIKNCEAEIGGKKTGFIDAMVMSVTFDALGELAGAWNWKDIKDNVNPVASDSQLAEQPGGPQGDKSSLEIADEDIPF